MSQNSGFQERLSHLVLTKGNYIIYKQFTKEMKHCANLVAVVVVVVVVIVGLRNRRPEKC